jgi:hypothetical protein
MNTYEKRELINALQIANEALKTQLPALETQCATAYHLANEFATRALHSLLNLTPEESSIMRVEITHSSLRVKIDYEYETRKGEIAKSDHSFDVYHRLDDAWRFRTENGILPLDQRIPEWSINHSSGEVKTGDTRNWHLALYALGALAREMRKEGESFFTQILPSLREWIRIKEEISNPSYAISRNTDKIEKLEREIVRDEFTQKLKEGAVYVREKMHEYSWGGHERNINTIKVIKMTEKTITWERYETRFAAEKEGEEIMRHENMRLHDTPRMGKEAFVSMLLNDQYVLKQ